jgi:hypothetical protein
MEGAKRLRRVCGEWKMENGELIIDNDTTTKRLLDVC